MEMKAGVILSEAMELQSRSGELMQILREIYPERANCRPFAQGDSEGLSMTENLSPDSKDND